MADDKADFKDIEIKIQPDSNQVGQEYPVQISKHGHQAEDNQSFRNDATAVASTSRETYTQSINLYAEDTGPKMYQVTSNLCTKPLILKNFPDAFKCLPIHGSVKSKADLEEFQLSKIREFVGGDISDAEFEKLNEICSPEHLKTGCELVMVENFPKYGPLPAETKGPLRECGSQSLAVVNKYKLRVKRDKQNHYPKKLKYRGLRLMPLVFGDDDSHKVTIGQPLQPGQDILVRIRVYRPFFNSVRQRHNSRYSIFSCDVVLLGRQRLTALRDRLVCANDVDLRVDVSADPEQQHTTTAKDIFPSGFLFINNVFYVDRRAGCHDTSEGLREWAARRGLGRFPARDMDLALHTLPLRLGHPEVYVHQGDCEHLFTVSEVRLLRATDPARGAHFPRHTALAHNQTLYCTTCAEFGAKWVVTGCARVPFDPAFFCETCFKMYLYIDGKKVGDFKAYTYKGNEINTLKP